MTIKYISFVTLILLLLAFPVWAQHSVYSGKPVQNASGRGTPASILVCTPTATGFPCSPPATIYTVPTPPSNPGSGTVIPSSTIQTDANGNYSFGCDPGLYVIQITVPGLTYTFVDTCPGVGSPTTGLTDPGSNGVLKRTALNVTAIATSADLIALWTGTCDASTFLRADGSCKSVIVNSPTADQTIIGTGSPRPRLIISGNSYNTTLTEDSSSPTDAIETHTTASVACCALPQGGWSLYGHTNTVSAFPATLAFARSLGTQGSPLAITNTTAMFRIATLGYDGTGYFTGASIIASAQETWTNTTHGTAMVIDYVPNGGITSVHGVVIGGQCTTNASPAVCGGSSYGVAAVPTGATPTLVIQTSQVTSISRIFLELDESSTIPSTTCNTTLAQQVQPVVTARSLGTSFTMQINATLTVNPACVSWWIIN